VREGHSAARSRRLRRRPGDPGPFQES
jgi:hypothetical protein